MPERAITVSNGVQQQVDELIAELLAGADALAKPESSAQGLDRIRQALAKYPHYFDHPDWPSAKTSVESKK
jgi:hypothetical protein